MKRIIGYMICLISFLGLCSCSQTGEMTYTGTYVKTIQGQSVLICSIDNGEEYFLLQQAEDCKAFDSLKTGDKITIYVPCLAYEDGIFTERTVYRWEKKLFGHTDVSQSVLDNIEGLLANTEGNADCNSPELKDDPER